MATAQYIEVDLTLDSFDLIQIETLIKNRVDELKQFKAENEDAIPAYLADEQLYNYNVTLKKIKRARQDVKAIKAEADAKYYAARNGRKRS